MYKSREWHGRQHGGTAGAIATLQTYDPWFDPELVLQSVLTFTCCPYGFPLDYLASFHLQKTHQ